MSIFSLALCSKLLQYKLKVSPQSTIIGNLTYRGPCVLFGNASMCRSKIDMFSYLNAGTTCNISSIGRYSPIGQNVRIGMPMHDTCALSTSPVFEEGDTFEFAGYHLSSVSKLRRSRHNEINSSVIIGHDVWIGDNVLIPSDVTIGHGAVIGAGTVITKDVPLYTVVVGHNRIVRQRFSDEMISDLLKVQWWNYNLPEMIKQGVNIDVNNPQNCIQQIKDSDPAKLIPIPKQWMFLSIEDKAQVINSVRMIPFEGDNFVAYYDPRHPEQPRIIIK